MSYALAMRTNFLSAAFGIVFMFAAAFSLRADEVEMQNGDRYLGKVLSVSADTVVLESEVLGKINVPRKNVASLAFGTNAVAPKVVASVAPVSVPTNFPAAVASIGVAGTNSDLSATLRNLGAGTNVIRQIRDQMLAASPEAAGKYDELVNGLLSGLKHDLGPDAGDSLDGYLEVLDDFLKEPESAAPTNVTVPQSKAQNQNTRLPN
jgi:hypothetical protein